MFTLLLVVLAMGQAEDSTLSLYDPQVIRAAGQSLPILVEGTITGPMSLRGEHVGALHITLLNNGTMAVKGLERLGVRGRIPYRATVAHRNPKSKFAKMEYTIASDLPDGIQRSPINLTFIIQVKEDHRNRDAHRLSSATVSIRRKSTTVSVALDGTWAPTAVALAPAATP